MNKIFSFPDRLRAGKFSPKTNWLFALLLLVLSGGQLAAQCTNDAVPPIMVCNADLFVSLDANGTANVSAGTLDEGSYDNCGIASLSIKRLNDGPCDSDQLPDDFAAAFEVCCADVGTEVAVTLLGVDSAGNSNTCWAVIYVSDKIHPSIVCPADTVVHCADFDATLAAYGTAAGADACEPSVLLSSATDMTSFNDVCMSGLIKRTFIATDNSGNTASCVQRIQVTNGAGYSVRFPDDVVAPNEDPNGVYGEPTFAPVSCELLASSYSDEVFTNVPGVDLLIERTWTVINWCTYLPNLPIIDVPNPNPNADPNALENLTGPVVAPANGVAPWAPTVASLLPNLPPQNFSAYWSANPNGYRYTQIIKIGTFLNSATLVGAVFSDTSGNCAREADEIGLAGWPIRITNLNSGAIFRDTTDANGFYSANVPASTTDEDWEIALAVPNNFGLTCDNSYIVSAGAGDSVAQSIPAHLFAGCPLMTVDISAPRLRRCFQNTYYVNYANLSAESIADARIEVALDPLETFISSSISANPLGNNLYAFELGTLEAGAAGSFAIWFTLSCDAPLGATHCTEANIYPDSLCSESGGWNGSNIEVRGICDQDSVRFTLTNTGAGAMAGTLNYIVVEDVIMYRQAQFQLGAGATMQLEALPADGSTWRAQTTQENGHPFAGIAAAAVEGCGGLNATGLVTMLPLNDPNPFQSIDCQENRGSFDPNDKSATPAGYGAEHFIPANTDIEYLVRFQNTGTDTAFRVVVLDTLDADLDANSVRPGAASHAYDFAVLDGKTLRFTFDNILLPDSNTNEAASHGFIKFRVRQQPNLPDGTKLTNRAAIYFDFNEAVLTNKTFHTVGTGFIVSATQDEFLPEKLRVFPNPSTSGNIWFAAPSGQLAGTFRLSDAQGKVLRTMPVSGEKFRFDATGLPASTYYYSIENQGVVRYSGQLQVSH